MAEISAFLDGAPHEGSSGRIPTGIVVTGPSTAIAGALRQLSRRRGRDTRSHIFVSLPSSSGSNLKAILKALIQKATMRQAAEDDESDEAQANSRKGSRLLNYDLQLLCDYVREQRSQQVVVAFEDTEAFDNDLLSELVEMFGSWRDRIPFVCLFNVATSVDFLQQRLSKAAIQCLDGRVFDVAPPSEVLEQVFEAVTWQRGYTEPRVLLFIGPGLASMALERQSDYIHGIDSFVDVVRYAYMSCGFANALGIFLDRDLEISDVPSDHFEALRNVDSFRSWAKQSLEVNEVAYLNAVLERNEDLFELATRMVSEGRSQLEDMIFGLTVTRTLQQSLPNTLVSRRSALYVQAMSGKLAGSALIRSLLLTIRKVPSDVAVIMLKQVSALDVGDYTLGECKEVATQLDQLIRAQTDRTQPLRSGDDIKQSTLRTTVVAQKVELSKQKSSLSQQDTEYTAILRRFTDLLEEFYAEVLVNPKDLLFHEIFVYDLKSPHREVFTPRPRHAIERALAAPHDYLDCDCCAPGQAERDETTLAATQPATAVLYQLYLESGTLINASDLWQAFHAVMGDGREEEQTMALFQRALGELRYLGLVKSTRKRVDHIAKVAWRGL